MKILILGSNGMLGPYVERVLQNDHDLLLTDVDDEYDRGIQFRWMKGVSGKRGFFGLNRNIYLTSILSPF